MANATPTELAYSELTRAYDHFNRELFAASLPPCLITLQRKEVRVMGYYSPQRFGSNTIEGETVDEIAMNPMWFRGRDVTEILQTEVHEMCHLWQAHCGTPSRRGYHNREWADKMIEIGLYPSSTGKPGGREVGQKMSDYPVPGGPFEIALKQLIEDGFVVSWYDRIAELLQGQQPQPAADPDDGDAGDDEAKPAPTARPQTRAKFTCGSCDQRAWAKPSAKLNCGQCNEAMTTEQPIERAA